LRVLDLPQAAAMAAERTKMLLDHCEPSQWSFPVVVSQNLEWDRKQHGIEVLSNAASK
jgi:hypothetical protein